MTERTTQTPMEKQDYKRCTAIGSKQLRITNLVQRQVEVSGCCGSEQSVVNTIKIRKFQYLGHIMRSMSKVFYRYFYHFCKKKIFGKRWPGRRKMVSEFKGMVGKQFISDKHLKPTFEIGWIPEEEKEDNRLWKKKIRCIFTDQLSITTIKMAYLNQFFYFCWRHYRVTFMHVPMTDIRTTQKYGESRGLWGIF